jgi:hypothetical protein
MHLNKPFARPAASRPRPATGRRGLALLAGLLACAGTTLAVGPAAPAADATALSAAAGYSPGLNSVSALSSTDAWAVGTYAGGGEPGVVLHWNGTAWAAVKSPNPGGPNGSTDLFAVNADSATDAWAVGYYRNPLTNVSANSLALHWNGTTWTKVASPSPGGDSGLSLLNDVTAISPTDAWAIGLFSTTSGQEQPLVLHWNGTSWTKVAVPAPGGSTGVTDLVGISADSATDAWITGYYAASSGSTGQSLTLHWNGTKWAQVTSPSPGGSTGKTFLASVHAISTSDVWASGYYSTTSGEQQPLILHWTGTAWQQVTSPDPGGATGETELAAVSGDSANDVWIAGSYQVSGQYARSLTLHWTGTSWKQVTCPSPGGTTHNTMLFGVSADATTDAWAAGSYYTDGGATASLLVHWTGTKWVKTTS